MQHTTSQSIRIIRYISLSFILYQCSIYSSSEPYVAMPHGPNNDVRIPIAPAQVRSLQAESLSRSVSHGSFQGVAKKAKKDKQKKRSNPINNALEGQSHNNRASTINEFSINVSQAKPRTCNNKLALGVSALVLAGMSVVLYLQVRITNQAEQIGANTGALDGIGTKLDASAASIATSAQTIATILELIVNATKKG